MRCHYEVLNIERDADDGTIKKAYRRMALKLHPDKNKDNEAEATAQFQLVQAAYAVLSDAQERAWYDSHREAILRGGSGADGDYEEGVDVMPYFSSSAYSSYDDDDDESFWAVYNDIFSQVHEEDVKFGATSTFIPFGNSSTPFSEVSAFYAHWEAYVTTIPFHSKDKWDIREAPNRRVRRLMEKDNEKERRAARREYNANIKALVRYVKKRDKRVIRHAHQQREAKAAAEAEREEQRKQQEEQRRIAREAAAAAVTEQLNAEGLQEKIAAIESMADDIYGADSSDEEEQGMYCVACNKSFRTQPAWENHQRSKKHLKQVEYLKAQLQEEDEQFEDVDEAAANGSLEFDDMTEEELLATMGDLDDLELMDLQDLDAGDDDADDGADMDTEAGPRHEADEAEDVDDDEDDDDNDEVTEDDLLYLANLRRTQQPVPPAADIPEAAGPETTAPVDAADPNNSADDNEEDKAEASLKEAEETDQTTDSSQPKQKRKGRRRAKKQPASSETAPEERHLCNVCEEEFETRNKLFSHIKATGHALHVANTASAAPGASSAGANESGSAPPAASRPLKVIDDEDPWADDGPRRGRKGKKKKK
ncbi:uncharacterized protein MONBRDRAFT_34486 [Monosiga brevicollis MX1]|uniref:J domain-containing protein n=1 Tax=Monosiga brevicollis TaxID=81824 RepID=A9VC16_MONBE|nr:uncharacterized protein MONBRDRAFT_34486 [Monosiga brevicollis MX1]EDQ84902.1 predicted protein [Monosiga brevicollis MX1]|eukprot:XP_001750243.1 hypothetical protein [Monosiga brevicollis MX1]